MGTAPQVPHIDDDRNAAVEEIDCPPTRLVVDMLHGADPQRILHTMQVSNPSFLVELYNCYLNLKFLRGKAIRF